MAEKRKIDVDEIVRDGHLIEKLLQKAAQEAVKLHKMLGNPIAIWRKGKVVWVPPEKIRVSKAD